MCWLTCFGEHKAESSSIRRQHEFRSSRLSAGCIPDPYRDLNGDESDGHISPINVKNLNGTEVPDRSIYCTVSETQQDINANVAQEITVFEILKAKDFSGKKILTGASGEMYYGVLVSGREAAVRKIDSKIPSQRNFEWQVSKVARLQHENIVELLGFCAHQNLRALAYEHAISGSLYDILYGRKGVPGSEPGPVLSWAERVKIATGAARGLQYLHEEARPTVIHGKVKSSNILIFDHHIAKLADLNLSGQSDEFNVGLNNTCSLGSFGYNAPECVFGNATIESDVYSFGVVLLELITGRKPIDRSLEREKHSLVNWVTPNLREDRVELCVDNKLRGEYPKKALAKMAALAAYCTTFEARQRTSMKIVVKVLQSLTRYTV